MVYLLCCCGDFSLMQRRQMRIAIKWQIIISWLTIITVVLRWKRSPQKEFKFNRHHHQFRSLHWFNKSVQRRDFYSCLLGHITKSGLLLLLDMIPFADNHWIYSPCWVIILFRDKRISRGKKKEDKVVLIVNSIRIKKSFFLSGLIKPFENNLVADLSERQGD